VNNTEVVAQSLIIMFKMFGQEQDVDKIKLYKEFLTNRRLCPIDSSELKQRIYRVCMKWKPTFGRKIPSIAEIIDCGCADMAHRDYCVFLENMNNQYKKKPIPDWVYTIKKRIGSNRCAGYSEKAEPTFKREYLEYYRLIYIGTIAVEADPKTWAIVPMSHIGRVAVPWVDIVDSDKLKTGDIVKLEPDKNIQDLLRGPSVV